MQNSYNKILCITITFIIFFNMELVIYADSSKPSSNQPTVYKGRLLLNGDGQELENKIIIKNNIVYFPLSETFDLCNIYKKVVPNESGIFVNDTFIGTIAFLKLGRNNVHLKFYNNDIVESSSSYSEIPDFKVNKEDNINIPSVLIYYNKSTYISSEFLTKILKFKISKTDAQIDLVREISGLNIQDYFTVLLEENGFTNATFINSFIEDVMYNSDTITNLELNDGFGKVDFVGRKLWVRLNRFPSYSSIYEAFNGKLLYIPMIITGSKDSEYQVTANNKSYSISTFSIEKASYSNKDIFDNDPKSIYKWSKSIWNKIDKGLIWTGMSSDMAEIAMGLPDDINTSVGSWGKDEQWVYQGSDYDNTYLYFRNGKLSSWQY